MTKGLVYKHRHYPRCEDCGKAFTACGGRVADGPIAKAFYRDPANDRLIAAGSSVRVPDKYRYETPPYICGKRIK